MWIFDSRTFVAPRLLNGQPWSSTWTTKFLLDHDDANAKEQSPKTYAAHRRGFSTIELLITATILTIVTGLGLMGISRAKASVRLSGSAREFASYIEKARLYSIRRHADNAATRANVAINDTKTSYNVTMDPRRRRWHGHTHYRPPIRRRV
jgi:type II secretory pathway pseudopilin PulG